MARLLDLTRDEWMRSDFTWGKTDCGLSVLDYVCRVLERRPLTYPEHTDETTAGELLQGAGGLLKYASGIMLELDLEQTPSPVTGDVGVVDLPIMGHTCAICTGEMWMMRGEARVLLARPTVLRAWRVV